jgi:hypothetical protein
LKIVRRLTSDGRSNAPVQVLTLLLALSSALRVAFTVGLIARLVGVGPAKAILTGAAGTVIAIFFAAVSPTANHDNCPTRRVVITRPHHFGWECP